MPEEWQLSLYRDETMMPIIEHVEIQPVIKTCEVNFSFESNQFSSCLTTVGFIFQDSLRQWCEEYIRRIDANYGKELRM